MNEKRKTIIGNYVHTFLTGSCNRETLETKDSNKKKKQIILRILAFRNFIFFFF